MRRLLVLTILSLSFLLVSSGFSQSTNGIAQASNRFAFDVFKEAINEDADTNVVISPVSLSYALGMTFNGARDETEKAMRTALNYGDLKNAMINSGYHDLTNEMKNTNSSVNIDINNSIWYDSKFKVKTDFINTIKSNFFAEILPADFSKPSTCNDINEWIEDKTHGKIPNMLDCPIKGDVVMYLINTIFFKGTWAAEFDKNKTKPGKFITSDGSRVDCMMMNQKNDFAYIKNDQFEVIDLPYGESGYSMTIFLPGQTSSVEAFLSEFNEKSWNTLFQKLDHKQEMLLNLPRFKVKYSNDFVPVLTRLGMGIAFSMAADFSGIAPGGGIFISRVLHNTFIQVDEQGTEAAATTIVEMKKCAMPRYMNINRPFIFMIHDNNSGAILFMGKIDNPVWEES